MRDDQDTGGEIRSARSRQEKKMESTRDTNKNGNDEEVVVMHRRRGLQIPDPLNKSNTYSRAALNGTFEVMREVEAGVFIRLQKG